MNVAVYARSGGGGAWTFTEVRVGEHERSAAGVQIGGSSLRWVEDRLVAEIDERTIFVHPAAPYSRRVRGRVVLHPEASPGLELPIDASGAHRWWPVAPLARIEVDLPEPGVRFSGHGYHDANAGDVPVEASFRTWNWSRARTPEGALLTYDVEALAGAGRSLVLKVSPVGEVEPLESSRATPLPRSGWGLPRIARADPGERASVVRSLEDGPFYSRALVETRLGGHRVVAMHETLAAQRLRNPLVRRMTAFRLRSVR